MHRRQAIGVLAGVAALVAAGGEAMPNDKKPEDKARPAAGPGGRHKLVPLPFDPRKLDGLSEKLLVSHWENNYGGAVKNLGLVEAQLATVTKDTPGPVVGGLRERELTFANSKVLHELYFGNLGGDGKASGAVESAIASAFGGFGAWEVQFRAAAMALAGGSGWVMLDYNLHLAELRIVASGGHPLTGAAGLPLLVLDMYEHAFHIDYGAAAAKYVDAFFRNVQWDEVARRYDRARQAREALRG